MKKISITSARLTFRRIYIGSIFSLVVLLAMIYLGYSSIHGSRTSNQLVRHTMEVITELQKIETLINELGKSERGYIITGQKRYSDKFKKDEALLNAQVDEVQLLTVDNLHQQQKINALRTNIQALMKAYYELITLVDAGDQLSAVETVKSGNSQKIFDSANQLIMEMIKTEDNLLKSRLSKQKELSEDSNALILAGSIVAFLMVLVASLLVILEFRRRIEAQENLHRTSQIQKLILDSAAFAMIAYDENGKINLFNPAAEKLLGYTAEEVLITALLQWC